MFGLSMKVTIISEGFAYSLQTTLDSSHELALFLNLCADSDN